MKAIKCLECGSKEVNEVEFSINKMHFHCLNCNKLFSYKGGKVNKEAISAEIVCFHEVGKQGKYVSRGIVDVYLPFISSFLKGIRVSKYNGKLVFGFP